MNRETRCGTVQWEWQRRGGERVENDDEIEGDNNE